MGFGWRGLVGVLVMGGALAVANAQAMTVRERYLREQAAHQSTKKATKKSAQAQKTKRPSPPAVSKGQVLNSTAAKKTAQKNATAKAARAVISPVISRSASQRTTANTRRTAQPPHKQHAAKTANARRARHPIGATQTAAQPKARSTPITSRAAQTQAAPTGGVKKRNRPAGAVQPPSRRTAKSLRADSSKNPRTKKSVQRNLHPAKAGTPAQRHRR